MHVGRAVGSWVLVALLGAGLCRAFLASSAPVEGAAPPALSPAQLRRPVDAVFLPDGTLAVANQSSGTVSLVDVSNPRVLGEESVGKHLTGLASVPGAKHLLVTDDERHELIALALGSRVEVAVRLAVGPYPVSVAVQPDGLRATVASLWSRRLDVVDVAPPSSPPDTERLRLRRTVRLPFAPRAQCVLPGRATVVVADAFGGNLAVVDVETGRLWAHHITGHNLRGLALDADGKHLLVSHQILDQKAPTTPENVERGALMANVVRSIPLEHLLGSRANLDEGSRLLRLEAGAADPAGLALLPSGRMAVALAGVDEVAFLTEGEKTDRVRVGRGPTALVAGPKSQPLVAVNTFDDSLSLLDQRGALLHTLRLGRQPELSYAQRGEVLFHDARLSCGAAMSCHSCHTDGHTNGLLADTFGDGSFGTPKRTLTLLGTRLTDPWGWDGKEKYLFDQVRKSLVQTMHAPRLAEDAVSDLTSFLSTLTPPPPLEPDVADEEDRQRLERGRKLFAEKGCGRCHIPPLTYSSGGVHDVGFADERGLRTFNPPSLRGVGQGYNFLHDGRAATLEEVFTKYHHKVGRDAPAADIDDLVRFLRSL